MMVAAIAKDEIQSITVEKEIYIAAPLDIAFESLVEELGPLSELPGKPMPMVFEAWPGGRWFRDLGNNAGHFWGHVQVIKPPTLIEIAGPMFMSYPALNHVQYRLTADGIGTKMKLLHRGFGQIPAEHATGVDQGWTDSLEHVRRIAEARLK